MHIDQRANLTTGQWALLGDIVRHGPLLACALDHQGDLRCLIDTGLVIVDQTMASATRFGMEVLWYHRLH